MIHDKNRKLRNRQWYGKLERDGGIRRSWMKNQGLPALGADLDFLVGSSGSTITRESH